jgi:hypothetical protein
MRSKRQTTMAKLARERAVKEKAQKKREKKQAAALEKARLAQGLPPEGAADETDEASLGESDEAQPSASA